MKTDSSSRNPAMWGAALVLLILCASASGQAGPNTPVAAATATSPATASAADTAAVHTELRRLREIGRASCRERV